MGGQVMLMMMIIGDIRWSDKVYTAHPIRADFFSMIGDKVVNQQQQHPNISIVSIGDHVGGGGAGGGVGGGNVHACILSHSIPLHTSLAMMMLSRRWHSSAEMSHCSTADAH